MNDPLVTTLVSTPLNYKLYSLSIFSSFLCYNLNLTLNIERSDQFLSGFLIFIFRFYTLASEIIFLHNAPINVSILISFYVKDLSSLAIEPEPPTSPNNTRGRSKSRDRKSLGPEQLRPLPESLEFDIK